MKKKVLAAVLAMATAASMMVGCGAGGASDEVYVVSREEGSGTRGAFVELMGIEQKDENGEKVDYTIDTAEVTSSTSVMMTTVQGNENAIGYISLGSYDEEKVKALKIDGAEATVENVKNGSYKVSRPFNIAYTDDLSEAGQDFVNFIMSAQGQEIIEAKGYITVDENAPAYEGTDVSGKVVVGGSTSVTPVMEKLAESYEELNGNVEIELQTSDSSTGMSATVDGTLDIGMASRELKDSEKEAGLTGMAIALDGIAVIINKENAADNLTTEQVMKIYTGEITTWGEME